MDSDYSDDDCYICFDVMWEPTKTPCNHYLCLNCLENVLRYKRNCPLCRTDVPISFKPVIDKERQKEIRNKQKTQISGHMKLLKMQKIFCDTLTLTYGNTHKVVNSSTENIHAWSTFVRLADNKLDISRYIKKVVFVIHPTFKDPVIEVTEAPFRLTRIGWGTFPVGISIHWQPWLEKGVTKFAHDLSFEGNGDSKTETIKFSKSIFQDEEDDQIGQEEAKVEHQQQQPQAPQQPALKTLNLQYGNRHSLVNVGSNGHNWTAFVSLNDDRLDISNYVERVVFQLHPTFKNPTREVTSAPFKLACLGWGTFEIGITVFWKPWLEKEPTVLAHDLSFEGDGAWGTKTVEFSKPLL